MSERAPIAARSKSFGLWHIVNEKNGELSLCGCKRLIKSDRRLARQVEDHLRCSRMGCRGNWPTYRAEGDNRLWRDEEVKIDERQLMPRRRRRMSTANPMFPAPSLLTKLGSLIYHLEEFLDTSHPFDSEAARSIREDPDVEEWFAQMRDLALLPVKRAYT